MRVSDRERPEKSVKKIRLNDTTKTTEQIERASKVRRTVDERRPRLPHSARAVPHDARLRARIPFTGHFSANRGARTPEGVELAEPTNCTVLVAHFSSLPVALLALKTRPTCDERSDFGSGVALASSAAKRDIASFSNGFDEGWGHRHLHPAIPEENDDGR